MKVLNVNDVKGERLGDVALRKTLVHSDNLMLIYLEGNPGGPTIAHSHPNEQLGFILQGTVEVKAGGETHILKAGSSFLIAPNEHHEARAIGDEKAIELDVFYPIREDYLPEK